MTKKNGLLKIIILLPIVWMSSCAQQTRYSSPPEYLLDSNACSIIKNSSLRFSNEDAQNLWFGINKAVVGFTRDELVERGYAIKKLIIDPNENTDPKYAVVSVMVSYKCKNIIQIEHIHNAPHDFGYDVSIMVPDVNDFTPSATSNYTLISKYEKQYRYPLTKKSFDNLIVSDIGKEIAKDILNSKALSK